MSARHAIIDDTEFWSRLEWAATEWLASSSDKRIRHFWIDGFIPESAKNTQRGADVKGIVWVGDGPRQQHDYRFIASVPQKLLHRRAHFVIDHIVIDETQKQFAISVSAASSPNQSLEPTAGRSDV